MPAFNAARFLGEAIESVLSQKYQGFELLILDNGSTDHTWQVLCQYNKLSMIRSFRFTKNYGPARAKNFLLRCAKGIYVTPCDADDLLLPGNLSELSSTLDRNPNVGLAYGDTVMAWCGSMGTSVSGVRLVGGPNQFHWDFFGSAANNGGAMIRRRLILSAGGYDERFPAMDDFSLQLRLSEITKFKYLKGSPLYFWRRHGKGTSIKATTTSDDYLYLIREAHKRRSCSVRLQKPML